LSLLVFPSTIGNIYVIS